MPINRNPIEILDLFNEKYERLESSSLIRFMNTPGWRFSFDFKTNTLSANSSFPDLEFIESYVLNLRFFIQDNESISIHNLSKFYDKYCHDKEVVSNFTELREIFKSEFNKSWPFLINGKKLTYYDIFNGFIYSKIAHSKPENHSIFQNFTKKSFGYYLALDYFLRCINLIHDILTMISHLNKTAFNDLKRNI